MTDFPGNPHAADAAKHRPQLVTEETANEHYLAEEGISDATMQFSALNRIAEAILTAAFEQRTANLIAMQALGITDMSEWHPDHAAGWVERAKEIGERTGGTK